ncbi:MAG: sulfatase [Phycisphaerae bacterium]
MNARMNRRSFLRALGAGAAALAAPRLARAAENAPSANTPNFIVIYADDQGYGDMGCYGSQTLKTPNWDRMAAEGMRFTDFYVTAPVCTPTRSSLMTGCYPRRIGLHQHVLFPNSTKGLNPSEITIAELLKARGYATMCIGKWHLGHQRQWLPTRQGFDSYYGIPFSNDMWLPAEMSYAKDATLPADLDAEQRKAGVRKRSTVPLMRDEEVIEYPADQATLTERYTAEAIKFITANKGKPFFLYLPHTMCHYPLHVSEKFKGKSGAGLLGDVIMGMDWSTGEILKAVKELGIDERTLVIYTSDNGPAPGSAGPLRGKKGSTWEGGMREPCIMRWPGKVPAGKVCSQVATIMDLLPTLAGLAGAKVPADRVIDGKDIWPLISGQPGAKTPHEAFFYHTAQGQLAAVRSGKWKLHIKVPAARRPRPKKGEKPAPKPKPPAVALYDLGADIGEKSDLAEKHPDVVERLRGLLKTFDAEITKNSRPVGRA